MVVVRKKRFANNGRVDNNLLDTPDKLLRRAEQKGIATCPLDVVKLAELLEICIKYTTFSDEDEDLSGILFCDKRADGDVWILCVNNAHHKSRQRFTIAHEIGHYCLHRFTTREFRDRAFFRGGTLGRMESEANHFAAEILMPEEEFRKAIEEGATGVDVLATKFDVSSLAVRVRAKELGYSGHGLS